MLPKMCALLLGVLRARGGGQQNRAGAGAELGTEPTCFILPGPPVAAIFASLDGRGGFALGCFKGPYL